MVDNAPPPLNMMTAVGERKAKRCEDQTGQDQHVGEIALAWGLRDLAHFGPVFRQHFSMSPRDWRHSRLAA